MRAAAFVTIGHFECSDYTKNGLELQKRSPCDCRVGPLTVRVHTGIIIYEAYTHFRAESMFKFVTSNCDVSFNLSM